MNNIYDEIFKEYVNSRPLSFSSDLTGELITIGHKLYFPLEIFTELLQNSDEDEYGKVDEKRSESVVLQEQLVGIINNLLQEQDNFRAR